jgi:hypothetical protein
MIFRPPFDRLPDARLRGIDRAQDLLLPGGFASVDQDLVNALLAHDVSLGESVDCWSSCELASNERPERLKSRQSDSTALERRTDIIHPLRCLSLGRGRRRPISFTYLRSVNGSRRRPAKYSESSSTLLSGAA